MNTQQAGRQAEPRQVKTQAAGRQAEKRTQKKYSSRRTQQAGRTTCTQKTKTQAEVYKKSNLGRIQLRICLQAETCVPENPEILENAGRQ